MHHKQATKQCRLHARSQTSAIALLPMALALGACSNVDLVPIQHSANFIGNYCTNDAATFDVPVRISLIIDTSKSMEENDPNGARSTAAEELVSELSQLGTDVAFNFISFGTSARQLTNGFVSDRSELNQALRGLNEQSGNTNYIDAISMARAAIRIEMQKVDEAVRIAEEESRETRFIQPWFFVVFLSDGIPLMPRGIIQSGDSILAEVDLMIQEAASARGITMHTAFLGAKSDTERPVAELLLKKMAEKAKGLYFSFEQGDQIDFRIFDFEVKRLFDIKRILVRNLSASVVDSRVLPDSDADGIHDGLEELLGSDPGARDSDNDGFTDGFEYRTALDPTTPDSLCGSDAYEDCDGDGLNDCEESFLALKPCDFDTDGDLFPDGFEFYSGSDPKDSEDMHRDPDHDAITTSDELIAQTAPTTDDAWARDRIAYQFDVRQHFDPTEGTICYNFSVDNISITPTQGDSPDSVGANTVEVLVLEAPKDNPQNIIFYRTTVEVEHGQQLNQKLTIHRDGFLPVAEKGSAGT